APARAPGDSPASLAPAASGNATLVNILGCLDRPTTGSYSLDGVDVSTLSRDERAVIRNAKIGFVFQSFNLLARTSAMENVELPLLYGELGWSKKERDAAALASLKRIVAMRDRLIQKDERIQQRRAGSMESHEKQRSATR